jgi:hypothetical protein
MLKTSSRTASRRKQALTEFGSFVEKCSVVRDFWRVCFSASAVLGGHSECGEIFAGDKTGRGTGTLRL